MQLIQDMDHMDPQLLDYKKNVLLKIIIIHWIYLS